MYPAVLMGLGILGNYYVLGGEIKDVKAEIKDVKAEIKDVKVEMKEGFTKVDKRVEKLEVRQTEGERQVSLVKEMFKNCATKK